MSYIKFVFLLTTINSLFSSSVQCQNNALLDGTIIITLSSQDTIWMGADSRTSTLTDKGYTVNQKGMCKIYSTNNVIYAMAGHVRYVDNSFNFLDIMQHCVNDQNDFDKSMERFQETAKIEIGSILKKFSKKSINTLVKTNNGAFLTVVAISFVAGERKMREMKFSIESIGNNNWSVVYNVTDDSGVGNLRFIGHATNASNYVKNNNLFFGNGRDIPAKINELIKLEADKTITVGMPADVLSIYNGGFKRVISSGLCSE